MVSKDLLLDDVLTEYFKSEKKILMMKIALAFLGTLDILLICILVLMV